MYQILFDPNKATPINADVEYFSTRDLTSVVLEAYRDIQEIDDILIEITSNFVNVKITLSQDYSNDLLEKLVSRQLKIHDKLKYYLFNFDYVNKNFFEPNDNEISILKPYASR